MSGKYGGEKIHFHQTEERKRNMGHKLKLSSRDMTAIVYTGCCRYGKIWKCCSLTCTPDVKLL